MGIKAALAAGGSLVLVFEAALALPTDDLVFCSKLPDKMERIHCYDAAARIAETRQRAVQRSAPAPRQRPDAPAAEPYAKWTPPPGPTQRANFHGPYAAIGASYGTGQPLATTDFAGTTKAPHGASGVFAAGYNVQSGNLVFGTELSGRYGDEGATHDAITTLNSIFTPYTLTQTLYDDWWWKSDAAVHLSGRMGFAIGDAMVFAQAGMGATHVKTGYTYRNVAFYCVTGTTNCTNLPDIAFSASVNRWYPSALFGAGFEYNWGRVFGRVSGEMEGILRTLGTTEPHWMVRGKGMVGYRF